MLTLKNLTADLMGETIIEDFNFTISRGEVACLYGSSGCGKTTILRLVAGIIDEESGTIDNQFSRTTYLFQEHRLLPWRTAWENIALVCKDGQNTDRQTQLADLLTQLALDKDDWHKYPHELSGGMRQRVALGRALITEPDLLLMDEPFSALDFELKQNLQNLILDRVHQHKMSIILVTHDRYEALRLADKIYILADKKPTQCQRVIDLDTPHQQRNALFIETHLQPNFWQINE
ncbi:MAG: ABC transporter ATP-binding protein [Gammaproteobacteria bacterium]|nr:ABC transporter ATP-binding protein [Gammaproteobacteria bacterium]